MGFTIPDSGYCAITGSLAIRSTSPNDLVVPLPFNCRHQIATSAIPAARHNSPGASDGKGSAISFR